MAWNQPGGDDKDKDPWGNRGEQSGPPDLDEVLKKIQKQLGNLFGGGSGKRANGGSGGGSGGLKFPTGIGVGVILAVAVVVWIFGGIYIVDPAEEAVIMRFGKYARTEGQGPHWAPPFIEEVRKVNSLVIRTEELGFRRRGDAKTSVPNEALMLTEDENIVDLQLEIQYRISNARDYLFEVLDPEATLRQAVESAVREVVGRSGMDFVITQGRAQVAADVKTLTQQIMDQYKTGLQITSVNMQDAKPPEQVKDAFLDAIKAREDQERIINEARAYASDVVPKARGESDAISQRAQGYAARIVAQSEGETDRFLKVLEQYRLAPEVTRERLYLDAIEEVMANTNKVLVDVDSGNNLTVLPLGDFLKGSTGQSVSAPSGGPDMNPSTSAGTRGENLSSRRARDMLRRRNR